LLRGERRKRREPLIAGAYVPGQDKGLARPGERKRGKEEEKRDMGEGSGERSLPCSVSWGSGWWERGGEGRGEGKLVNWRIGRTLTAPFYTPYLPSVAAHLERKGNAIDDDNVDTRIQLRRAPFRKKKRKKKKKKSRKKKENEIVWQLCFFFSPHPYPAARLRRGGGEKRKGATSN